MTESAKQGTTKAQAQATETEHAATESAATQGDAQPQATADPGANADAEAGQPADLDETKRKFREALERKHQAHNDSQDKGGREGSKISNAHGPATSRRNFRRKSG